MLWVENIVALLLLLYRAIQPEVLLAFPTFVNVALCFIGITPRHLNAYARSVLSLLLDRCSDDLSTSRKHMQFRVRTILNVTPLWVFHVQSMVRVVIVPPLPREGCATASFASSGMDNDVLISIRSTAPVQANMHA